MGTKDNRFVNTLTCYEEFAEDYDAWEEIKTVTQTEEKVLSRLMDVVKAQDILDVGCGTGRYTKLFEDLGAHIVGMDLSRKMILIAKTKTKMTSYIVADASHLPFKDNIFHIVLSALVLNHIKNLSLFLTEMLRTCRKGGELIMSSVWREGVFEVKEFPEYFGKNFEFTVQEYLYPPNILCKELSRIGARVTHSILSLYVDYGEGQKGIHIIKAKKEFQNKHQSLPLNG